MKISILGLGNMGQAIFKGLESQLDSQSSLLAFDRHYQTLQGVGEKYQAKGLKDLLDHAEVLFVCIKPQDFCVLKDEFKSSSGPVSLLVSVMAGISVTALQTLSGAKGVIRCMPNLGLAFDKGATAFFKSENVESHYVHFISYFFSSLGFCFEVREEEKLNAVTAISGSGPAYFLYLAQTLIEEAKSLGFEEKEAQRLVTYTLIGTARGIERLGFLPSMMIDKVASKGGTTEQALASLKEDNLDKIVGKALKRALERATELGS
ncbi:hypothetical protein AB751O23_AA_00300 [Chlamydiales bacterium SCGC AB-751-O23]|jgi:pyrroline-5-carboxylate reductase|nr:hypothetical protein AB751O23_AA_00300 [Chlamydiales bacterium SCGC AB-751-O23]